MAKMDKHTAAEVLEEIAVLLELSGENPFKSRAYTSAARTLEATELDVTLLAKEGRLAELPGFGEAMVSKVGELFATGKLGYHEKLRASIPAGMLLMLDIPGLGPKKIRALHEKLGIEDIPGLQKA